MLVVRFEKRMDSEAWSFIDGYPRAVVTIGEEKDVPVESGFNQFTVSETKEPMSIIETERIDAAIGWSSSSSSSSSSPSSSLTSALTPSSTSLPCRCFVPGCGKSYLKMAHLKAHLRWHDLEKLPMMRTKTKMKMKK